MSNLTWGVHIDWVTATGRYEDFFHADTKIEDSEHARIKASQILGKLGLSEDDTFEPVKGMRFYRYAYRSPYTGASIALSTKEGQGFMVTLPGKWFARQEGDGLRTIEKLATRLMRLTRVDVALDIWRSGIKPLQVWRHVEPASGDRPQRKMNLIASPSGETLALGSRQSQFYCRIYDKGAEQKADVDWLRVELEIKDEPAHNLPMNLDSIYQQAAAKMLEMIFDCPPTLVKVLSDVSEGVEPMRGRGREDSGDTERWFMTSVLPALRNLARKDRSGYNRVCEAIMEAALNPVDTEPLDGSI